MSQAAVDVEVRLRLKDGAAAELKATAQAAQQQAQAVSTATERAAKKAQESTERSNQQQRTSHERLSHAREALGVRSEKAIQREIDATRQAYGRLAAAGFSSAQEQERAYAAVQSRVTRLTNEMGKLTAAQQRAAAEAKRLAEIEARSTANVQRGQAIMRYGAAGVAGVGAAAYTLRAPVMQAMSYDERLAHMANTAYNSRDLAGRRAGQAQLEAAINKSIGKGGGGTRDQAAEALDSLIASGVVDVPDAMRMLPQIMRFSSASGTNANDLAQIGIRAMQTFKIAPGDLPRVLNMAIAAGQEGGFELRDMAKWLPQQMAAGTMSGLSGRAGFAKLAALNQAAAVTAGTKDEAGNNVVNLLAKINSSDTANDAKKLGINLPKYLQDQRAKGVDSVDAFGALVEKTVSGRADYKALQQKLGAAGNDDQRKEALESMATIAQGAGIGKLIQDRQALMALLGMLNRQYMDKVLKSVVANDVVEGGAGDKNYELISGTSAFKLRQAEQQKEAGQKAALDGLTPAIGRAAEAFGDLAAKHPLLVGAGTLATAALTALAGAAGLAALAVGGGNGAAAGAIGRYASRIAGSPITGAALRTAKVGGAAGLGAMVGGYALEKGFGEDSAITRYGSSALNGAAAGAMIGSLVPVVGTAVGAAIGGAGGLLFEGIKDFFKPSAEQKPTDVNFAATLQLAPGLVIADQRLQAPGSGNVRVSTGNLMNGAP